MFQFKGNGYGELSVCAFNPSSPGNDKVCKGLVGNSEVSFLVADSQQRFSVAVTRREFRCAGSRGGPIREKQRW